MDLLSQYKQDHPEEFQEKKPSLLTDEYGRTYSGMIALVMRLSRGRIRDARQAIYALAIAAGVIFFVSLFFFFRSGGASLPPAREILRDTPPSGLRQGAELPQ